MKVLDIGLGFCTQIFVSKLLHESLADLVQLSRTITMQIPTAPKSKRLDRQCQTSEHISALRPSYKIQ